MVRIVSFCVWLGACATSTLVGAQASSAKSAAKSQATAACARALTATVPSTCASLDVPSGPRASPALPAQTPSAQGESADLAAYASAWTGYQAWRDDAVGDWRDANAVVGHIGGWRVYAREAAPIANTPAAAKGAP